MAGRLVKSSARAVAALVCAAPILLGTASAAHADPPVTKVYYDCKNGAWSTCFYYNSNGQGATGGFGSSIEDLIGNYYYCGLGVAECLDEYAFTDGSGNGDAIKNNAASVTDGFYDSSQYVYYNSDYQGPDQAITPNDGNPTNLNSTLKNEDASLWAVPDD